MDVQQTSRFADRVLRLLERVEYRRADSPADKAAIYRLRHDAYMRAGTVEPKPSGMFHDAMDQKDNAWLIGFQYGKAVNKGEWDARVAYQSVAAFALDPNLVDSDVFDSRVNMEGWVVSANYQLGAATTFTVTYANGDRKEASLPAIGSGDAGTNNKIDNYSMLQVNVNVKF